MHARPAFTLIELIFFIVMIECVLQGGKLGRHIVGGVHGWLLGGFLGLIAFFLAVAVLALLGDLWGGMPRLPKCRNGCCRGPGMFRGEGDYEFEVIGEEYRHVCRCGHRYRRRGRRFVEVNEDGTEAPYLVWRPFRGWFPEVPGLG
jgi:hypothetical protein